MTTFSDNFDRTNGALGSNWAAVTGFSALEINSGSVRGAAGGFCAQIVATGAATFGNDQEATVAYVAVGSADRAGPMVRCNPAAGTGYALDHDGNSRSLIKFNGETAEEINDPWERFAVEETDDVQLRVVGDQLSVYHNGVLLYTKTDATYASGQPGIYYRYDNSHVTRVDGFLAEDIGGGEPGEPALAIEAQPTTTASGYVMDDVVVHMLDADGELDTSFDGDVTVELVGSGVLLGTLVVAAVAGVATFDALRPCIAGSYELRFSADGVDDLDSAAFTVTSGSGGLIIGDSMQSPPIPKNSGTATLRRIYLDIRDSAGAAWAGSVSDVKAKLSKGGGSESDSPADIVRIGGSLHYVECAQTYVNDTEGLAVVARVPAASGRLEARTVTSIIPADSYAASLQQQSLVIAMIRASVGLDGFGFKVDEENGRVQLTIPGVGVVNVDAAFGPRILPLLALGAAA